MSTALYPRESDNIYAKEGIFGFSLGNAPDLRGGWEGFSVMEAPVLRVEDNPFLVNRYGKEKQYAEGRVSLEFAERVLGGKVPEGSEIVLALIEKGESPETGETYMARLKATKDPYPEDPEPDLKHPVLIDEIPDGMDYGTLYDFIVSYVGGDYMLFESQDDTEPIDHLVDLRDMQ